MADLSVETRQTINELRGKLNEAEILMNRLSKAGLIVKFGFTQQPDGEQKLTVFEVLAPIDLDKLRS